MVWGCIASSGVEELVFIDGSTDKVIYKNILQENLKKSARKLDLGNNYYFQQDNDPKHTAEVVQCWIMFNIPHILWTSPQSPDLNPIEEIWNELEDKVRKHHITSKTQLKEIIIEEWNKLSSEITKKYVHSMPKRLAAERNDNEVLKFCFADI